MSSEIPTWPKISGALGSTTTEFGASDWANLISDYFNGINLALVDASKLPVIGSLTKFKYEKLGLYDVDSSHYLSFSVDDIDTGANRKVKFRRMNTPFEEDYAVLEGMPQTLINKILDTRLNTIPHIGRHKYEIFKDGSTWYCRNTITGVIASTNSSPTVVLQYAITNAAGAGILVKSDTLLTVSEINCIDKPFLLEGEGSNLSGTAGASGATIIKANFTGATGDAVFDCHNTGYCRQYFKNIVIDADAKVDYCIDSFANREVEGWLDNVALVNFKKSGHKMEACWQNSMINPTIMSGTSPVASSIGIEFVRGASPPCNTIRIRGGKIANNDINISCDGTNDIACFGTILEGFGTSAIKTFNGANANRFYGNSVEYAALSSKVTIDEAGNANIYSGLRFDAAHTAYNIITVRAACRNLIFKDALIQANNSSTTATIIIEAGVQNIDFKDNKQLTNTPLTVTITDNQASETQWIGNSFTPDKLRAGIRFGSNRLFVKEVDANTLGLYADDATTRKNFLMNGLLTSVIRTTGSTDMIDLSNSAQIDFKGKNLLNGVVGSTITGIVDTNIASGAAIAWAKILKTGSILGDIADTSLATPAQYDLIMRNGSSQWGKLPKGSNSTALTTDSSGVVAYTTITNAMLAGSIATSKLTDASNFALINQVNTFGDFLQTFNGKVLVRKTSGSSDFEDIFELGITDQTGDYLKFQNNTSTNTVFAPLITASTGSGASGANTHIAMQWRAMIKPALDTGTVPVIRFEGRQNDGTTVDVRPILGISNVGTDEYLFYPTQFDMTGNALINSTISGLKVTVNAKTADYTATSTDDYIPCAPAANMTITLPPVSSSTGKSFLIQKTNSNGFTVTVDGAASEQINGATTSVLSTQYQSVLIYCDGAAWYIANSGSGGGGATNLDALTDVDLTTTPPSNGDVLTYTTTGTKWVPAAPPGSGGTVTASSVTTFTNKTIDADGSGNSITNIENADIKAAANIAITKLAIGSAQQVLATNAAGTANAFTNPIPITYDYIISKISTTYYATKSGETIPKYSNTVLHTLCASVVSDLGATGGVIAFAANTTFSTNGGEIILADNITWKGMDRITSIIKSTTNHQIFRWFPGVGVDDPLLNAGITDLHLIIHDTLSTKEAVYVDGSVNFKFNRNWVESKGSSGSSIPATGIISTFFDTQSLTHFHYNLELKDNWYSGYQNGQDAFGSGNVINGIVTGNTFKDHTDGQAMGPASAVQTIFSNNSFYNTGNMIGLETDAHDNIISNNIGYNTTGIKMAGDASSNISRRNLVSDNIIIYGAGGIEAGNCYYDTFVNNKIIRTSTYGIRGALHNCIVRNNEFIDTNHSNASTTVNSVSNTRGGIMIINNTANQPDSDNNIIQGNRLVDTGATFTDPVSATSKSGNTGPIVLDTNCDSNILIDNQYLGLVGGTVVDYGTNTLVRGLTPDMYENSKTSELFSELFIGDAAYGSGLFSTNFEAAQGTSAYDFGTTPPSRHYTTGAVTGNKAGRVSDGDIKRNMLPKFFCKFAMAGTSNHALFIGLATGFSYDAVHATTPLNAMMGIGVAAITGVSNFRIIHNDASGACTSLDTNKALDTSFHTIEIWSDDTNWYYDFDKGFKKGTITTDMPDSTTRMYLQWTNLTNTTATQKMSISKMVSKVRG